MLEVVLDFVQWLFKITTDPNKGICNICPKLCMLQCPYGYMLKIKTLGSPCTFMTTGVLQMPLSACIFSHIKLPWPIGPPPGPWLTRPRSPSLLLCSLGSGGFSLLPTPLTHARIPLMPFVFLQYWRCDYPTEVPSCHCPSRLHTHGDAEMSFSKSCEASPIL